MVKLPKYFKLADVQLTGIYFLMVNRTVLYIGQTTDIFQRIKAHSQSEKPFIQRHIQAMTEQAEIGIEVLRPYF
jgi:excinuclease UvrABC nuclease subunit